MMPIAATLPLKSLFATGSEIFIECVRKCKKIP